MISDISLDDHFLFQKSLICGEFEEAHRLLEREPRVLHAGPRNGHLRTSWLHWASKEGHIDVARWAMDQGLDINGIDDNSKTPLMTAIYYRQDDIANLLMDKGADPLIVAGKRTALHNAAADDGSNPHLQRILGMGVDVEFVVHNVTPLYCAVEGGAYKNTQMLLAAGANSEFIHAGKSLHQLAREVSHTAIGKRVLAVMDAHHSHEVIERMAASDDASTPRPL